MNSWKSGHSQEAGTSKTPSKKFLFKETRAQAELPDSVLKSLEMEWSQPSSHEQTVEEMEVTGDLLDKLFEEWSQEATAGQQQPPLTQGDIFAIEAKHSPK